MIDNRDCEEMELNPTFSQLIHNPLFLSTTKTAFHTLHQPLVPSSIPLSLPSLIPSAPPSRPSPIQSLRLARLWLMQLMMPLTRLLVLPATLRSLVRRNWRWWWWRERREEWKQMTMNVLKHHLLARLQAARWVEEARETKIRCYSPTCVPGIRCYSPSCDRNKPDGGFSPQDVVAVVYSSFSKKWEENGWENEETKVNVLS